MRVILTSALLFFITVNSVSGTNYYVSKQGSDSYDGSKETPFLTITKAASKLYAGDTCFIMEGTYREVLSAMRNGTAELPIVFKAFESDSVLVSATEAVEGWMADTGDIYRVPVSMALGRQNMLYFNGKAMDWARWPNNSDNNRFTIDASAIEGGSASTIVDTDIPDLDWSGGYMWYLGAHSGASWTRPIRGYNPASHTLTFDAVDINKWPFTPHNPTVYRNGNRGRIFLFGTMEALDYPGEWFFDDSSDTLYFQAPGNVDPSLVQTEISKRTNTISLGTNYIHVDGIHCFGGRIHITGNNCVIRNGTFRHCLEILDELDNTDAQMGNGSIDIEGSNILIENNIIEFGSSNGIALLAAWKGSKNNTIRNNVIRHFNTIGIHSGCIRSSCPGTKIIGNTINSCGRDGVYVSGGNSEIAYNDIYDCMKINNDGGVFYTVGNANLKYSRIHHNWCHDSFGPSYADGRAAGIYLDNDSKGYSVYNNVVWNVTWTAVQMNWDNWHNNIFNNSFWQVGGAMGNWLNGRELIDNKIYNNYSNVGSWIGGNDFRNNMIDPTSPFRDESFHDFSPANGSILIDEGMHIPGITDQFLGRAPDVGAYEFGISPWRPGVNHEWGGDTLSNMKIEFTSPAVDQVFAFPADVVVEAENLNGEEGVSMSLFMDDQFISNDSVTPFRWEPADYEILSGMAVGNYKLKILASDNNGYALWTETSFSVIAGSVGDEFQLGNLADSAGTADHWTSNMIINKTDVYTNLTDTVVYLQAGDFSFYAQNLADPVTPFVVRINGENDFTVLSVGDTRSQDDYLIGKNQFPFRESADTTLSLQPGETIATGFLDAFPDGSGGGLGPVIPYDKIPPADQLWYTGGPEWYQSGSIIEGYPPIFDIAPRTFYMRNYHFHVGFIIADTIHGTTGFRHQAGSQGFRLHPNPVTGDHFYLSSDGIEKPVLISIFDLQGRMIFTRTFEDKIVQISSSVLPSPGTYLVKAGNDAGTIYGKLIKQ